MKQKESSKIAKPKPYIIKPAEVFAPTGRGGCRDQEGEQK